LSYYSASAFPTLVWHGTVQFSGASVDDATGTPYRARILSNLGRPSAFKITVNSVSLTSPTGSIDLDIEVMEGGVDVSNMFLRIAVTEDDVTYNAEAFDDVLRDMVDDVAVTVNDLGEVQNVVRTFPVDPSWVPGNMEVIPILQDDTDRKIHAAGSSLTKPDYSLGFFYLGERQIIGPSTGEHSFDNFAVFNLGTLTDTYTVELTGHIPDDWVVEISDGVTSYGTTYSQQLAPGESMELHINVEPGSSGYAAISVDMSQANLVHKFPRSIAYIYNTDDLDVLLVDDDGGETYEDYFTDALEQSGYTFGVLKRLEGGLPTGALQNFPIVVWNIGWSFPTLDAQDRETLGTFLDAGGSLFISGQDIGYDLNDQGGEAYQWYQDYLHAIYVSDDTDNYTLDGVAGDPVSGGIDLVIQGGDGADNQEYPSDIDPADGSTTVIWSYDTERNGAVRADNGTSRVIYLAFGFEAIDNADDRREVMQRSITWLDPENETSSKRLLTGPGPGFNNPPLVKVFPPEQDAVELYEFSAYGATNFGVNVACGDVTGSGLDTILTGAGPGDIYGPHVRGFSVNGTPLSGLNFLAYGTNKYGVNVAAGDIDGDGYDEIITGAGPGAVFGPHVRAWNYDGTSGVTPVPGVSYFAYGTPKWGVNVSAGDIDGDGYDEIVTGAGPGAVYGPHVRGWNVDGGKAVAMPGVSFLAYGTNKYGVNATCGDVDGDGIAEIITGPGPGAVFGAHIRGWNYDGSTLVPLSGMSFFAWDYPGVRFGARVFAGADLNGDLRSDLVVGCGPDPEAGTQIKVYLYDGAGVTEWFSLTAYSDLTFGTSVSAGGF